MMPDERSVTMYTVLAAHGSEMYIIFLRSGRSATTGQRSALPVVRAFSGPSGTKTHWIGICRRCAAAAIMSIAGPSGLPSLETYCCGGEDWKPTRNGRLASEGSSERWWINKPVAATTVRIATQEN